MQTVKRVKSTVALIVVVLLCAVLFLLLSLGLAKAAPGDIVSADIHAAETITESGWTDPTTIFSFAPPSPAHAPSIAVEQDGTWHIAYIYETGVGEVTQEYVMYQKQGEAAQEVAEEDQTWEPGNWHGNRLDTPSVAVDSLGKVHLTYIKSSIGMDGAGAILYTSSGLAAAPSITSITPTFGVGDTVVDVTLAGKGFKPGALVWIDKTGTTINATNVKVVSSTQITCTLNLTGTPLGKYDVVVRNPDVSEAKLIQGFSVTNICGGGAAISLSVFGIMMGLISLAGSTGLRRRFRRKKR